MEKRAVIHTDTPPAIVKTQEQTLAGLAVSCNAAISAGSSATRQGLAYFRKAGTKLIEAKERCLREAVPWLPWLAEHIEASERTCQNYMRLAREWGRVEGAVTAETGLEEAMALLRGDRNPDAAPVPQPVHSPEPPDATRAGEEGGAELPPNFAEVAEEESEPRAAGGGDSPVKKSRPALEVIQERISKLPDADLEALVSWIVQLALERKTTTA